MSLLKTKDQLIQVPMYYIEKDMGTFTKIIIIEEEKAKKMLEDNPQVVKSQPTQSQPSQTQQLTDPKNLQKTEAPKKSKIQCLNTWWKIIGWKEQNQITKLSQIQSSAGSDIDFIKMRDLTIKMCLKRWDLKDDEGKDVQVSADAIDALPAEVVYYLDNQYRQKTSLTEEEIKNL